MGVLFGRYELLDALTAYRVRPAPATPPGKFETGTGSFEAMNAILGTLDYFEWLGKTFGADQLELLRGQYEDRPLLYKQAMHASRAYEFEINRLFLNTLQHTPGVTLYGPTQVETARTDLFISCKRKVSPPGGTGICQGRDQYLGWQFLRPGSHPTPGSGGQWWFGTGWCRPLQYPGRNSKFWRSLANHYHLKIVFYPNNIAVRVYAWVTHSEVLPDT